MSEQHIRYMMATKASHILGDLSHDVPGLCLITDEDADNYIGHWAFGFGFVNVKFPKATTRSLTKREKRRFHGSVLVVGREVRHVIDLGLSSAKRLKKRIKKAKK